MARMITRVFFGMRCTGTAVFLWGCLLAGCVGDTNLSRHKYFAPSINTATTIQREAILCRVPEGPSWSRYRRIKLMVVAQNCRMMQGDLLIVLTPGEPIRITKVLEGTGFNQGGIRALGEVRGYEFEYYWGGRLMPLLLAPWENGEFDPGRCMGTILQSCSSLQELDNE